MTDLDAHLTVLEFRNLVDDEFEVVGDRTTTRATS
jgi:hypothetical protein